MTCGTCNGTGKLLTTILGNFVIKTDNLADVATALQLQLAQLAQLVTCPTCNGTAVM